MKFVETLSAVRHGRDMKPALPPPAFLAELVEWARQAPDSIFARNNERYDVLSSIYPQLGPWMGEKDSALWILNRKAAMLEVMRVLGAFESDWRWNEGKDQSSHKENDDETKSAGLWQISYNSRHFGDDLVEMLKRWGVKNGAEFQGIMKTKRYFAMEYAARLFRHTTRHNGPLLRKEVNAQVNKFAMSEFEELLIEQPESNHVHTGNL